MSRRERSGVVEREWSDAEARRFVRAVPPATCILVALAAAIGLLGWFAHAEALLKIIPTRGAGMMMPITAIGLLLCSGSLWLLRTPPAAVGRWRAVVGRGLAAAVVVMGAANLAEYVFDVNVGIDFLAFRTSITALAQGTSGRPSAASAVSFIAIGIALLLLDVKSRVAQAMVALSVVSVAFIGLQATVGYAYSEQSLYAPERVLFKTREFTPMALHTALSFLLLALGVICARPDRGLGELATGDDVGSFILRRLLPVAILAPFLLGLMGLIGQRAGLYALDYGMSLLVVAMMVLFAFLIAWSAVELRRLDRERRRAVQALREREALFRGIFNNAGTGIGLVDLAGRPVASNRALQEMLGFTEEEMARLPFTDFTHPDDAATDWGLFQQLIAGKMDSYRIEKRFIRKDGTVFWGLLNASIARDTEGRVRFLIGLVEDITERKAAEQAQRRLTAILENTPDFVGTADTAGRALYVNRGGREMSGISEEEVPHRTIPDFHPSWAAKLVMEVGIPAALRDGVWTGESALLRPDGQEIPVSQVLLAHRGPQGEVEFLSTVIRDITERKRLEEAQRFLLDASRAFSGSLEFDAVLRSITQLVVPRRADFCVVDLIQEDGTIQRAAVAHADPEQQSLAHQLRDYAAGSEGGPGVPDVVRTGKPLLVADADDATLAQLARNANHLEATHKLGPRSIIVVPLVARGTVIGAISLVSTQLGRRYGPEDLALAEELAGRAALGLENARLFRQSREATRVRDQVLRIVAHDLRNPLNTIALSAGYLRDFVPELDRADVRENLEIIERSVKQSNRLIQDLLDVARMEAGRLSIQRTALDVAAVTREAVELHRALADQRSIRLIASPPDRPARIYADRDRVLQIFSNIIGNALKFSPEGGRVSVYAEPENGWMRFAVSDQGPGIPGELLPHLFDPFWHLPGGTGGTGLGLSISRGIVQAHGGRIWVQSEPGAGTTFFFTLPLETKGVHESRAA
jgi:PAS domain S-box-containing protein